VTAVSDELPTAESGEKSNILIVDDLAEKLLVFGTVLEELNQNLVFVRSGREALREVLQREFAVILLDVNMPDIDGFETATLIRQYKPSALTPIIFITSYADEMQTALGYSLGAVDYILAPVVPHVLRSKVQVFVQLHAMQRQIRRQADTQAAFAAAESARRVAEENDRRSAFLADASRVLNRSLQVTDGVRDLAGLVVPAIAPLALVMLAEDAGPTGSVLLATEADAGTGALRELARNALPPALLAALQAASDARRRSDLAPPQLEVLNAAGFGASNAPAFTIAIILPLLNGDRLLGALLVAARGGHAAPPAWQVLDELGTRAAAALENARLYEALQDEIVERRGVEAELQETSRRKDEFLAMLSHELRNPLAPIRTAAEVMRRLGPTDAKFTAASDITVRQLGHLTRLVDELLDVARISRGKIVLRSETIDLNAVLSHCVETAQPFVDSLGQRLNVASFPTPIWVRGDFARLAQVVSNVLHNASKYSAAGSSITLNAHLEAATAVIRVRDEGIGIDAQLLPHVFDLFTQGQRGLDRSQGGLGIGLTLARRLAELHGGTLEAFSDGPDQGSELVLTLPGTVRPSPVPVTAPVVAPPSSPPCRILIVDDNRDAAESIAAFFKLQGQTVRVASDGLRALNEATQFAPDVVVLDIGLPLLDGYEVARRMRQLPATSAALLVALTGYGQADDRTRSEAAGFDRHFVKPADPAALLSAVHAWASGRAREVKTATAPVHTS
jgi:signal transduction histidine kinase/DNA-binding response OmpR family regulator